MQYQQALGCSLRGFSVVLMSCLLLACASSPTFDDALKVAEPKPTIPIVYYAEFGEKPAIFGESEIFSLNPDQQKEFFDYINRYSNRDVMRHKRVADYLKKFLDGFNYHNDTFIASESASLQQGNCLSLAILTTSLARLANIDVAYELMHTPPVYQKKGNTILSSQHVRSILYEPSVQEQEGFLFTFQPVIKIDYFPTNGGHVRRRVPESEFISMYYRNKAAEAIVKQDLPTAFWLTLEALDYAENNAHATNMLALIYDRMGFAQDAENLYKFGMENSDERLELLSNYHNFLLRNNRLIEADEINRQIAELDDPNPFDWLDLADEALAQGKLSEAKRYYEKVVELAPYLHHGYSGIGRVEFLNGNTTRARKAFSKASELALEKDTRAMYQAKLAALMAYTQN